MITRRLILIRAGAAIVASAAALADTGRTLQPSSSERGSGGLKWYPTAYHNVKVSDPNSSWRVKREAIHQS